ncbi:sulfatase-like hydrolase/transferase, partial [Mycobacterium tuberculosis]|uniref:sulfatase-like hydrolase/transferase n=1 Tax=Mycobacterium tuberculosis TaxID=1773 RepID=UPI001EEE427D
MIIVMTDEERAVPPYESAEVLAWRQRSLTGRRWFDEHGISFTRHYTGSLACVPSRPTIFTGQYPDLHGVTQTDGIGKRFDDSRLRWLRAGEVPTLGNWFRAAGQAALTPGEHLGRLVRRHRTFLVGHHDDD